MKSFEVFLVIDSDGDYEVGIDRDQAVENFEQNIGNPAGARVIMVSVKANPPAEVEDAGVVIVPDTAGATVEASDDA